MRAPSFSLPDPFPWAQLAGPLAVAEDALARLDERLDRSPIRDGWIERTHYAEARAALALEGALVDVDDLVLHDAGMDVRAPTHELVRAHALLRIRRAMLVAAPDEAIAAGLRRRAGEGERKSKVSEMLSESEGDSTSFAETDAHDPLSAAFADLDAALARTARMLDTGSAAPLPADRDPFARAAEHDEAARLVAWRATVVRTREMPPTLAAAIALEAWATLVPIEQEPGLGRLLAAALLRERGKARAHLPCLALGLRALPRERRDRARDPVARLLLGLEAIAAAAGAGLADHDRWLAARVLLLRKCEGRRTTSRLPGLVDLVLARPIVSAGMIAKALDVTPRAAQDLVADLELREMTGRGRYRAWGVL